MRASRILSTSVPASLVLSLVLLIPAVVHAEFNLSGQVMRVLGPDTIEVRGPGEVLYQVHLRGTAAGDPDHPAAFETETRLISGLVGRHVTLTNVTGSGTRLEAVVRYGQEDLNRELIEDGMLRFDNETAEPGLVYDYTTAEDKARMKALGVWRPMEPRETPPPPALPAHPLAEPEGGWQFRPAGPGS
jgi:endonuclease YncB( thermonuclease family)